MCVCCESFRPALLGSRPTYGFPRRLLGRSKTLSVIYDMHDPGVERGESSSQRQAQGAFFTPSSFSSLCWLPTTTPSSSRCAKRGACRSALPRPPIRISSVFVPQILRDAPLGSRAKRRTAASSARKSRRKIGCGGQLDLRIQNTRPLLMLTTTASGQITSPSSPSR